MKIGEIIREERKRLGFKQTVFATELGITQTALSQIETGDNQPSISTLNKFYELVGSPSYVLHFKYLTEEEIAPEKREAFRMLKPAIDALIQNLFLNGK